MLISEGDETRAVITDFGLARHADQRSPRMLKGSGHRGTVAYNGP